jgi:hypothetical protein
MVVVHASASTQCGSSRQLPVPVANCLIAHVNEATGKHQGIGGHSRSEERGKKIGCNKTGSFEDEGRLKPAHQRWLASSFQAIAIRSRLNPVYFLASIFFANLLHVSRRFATSSRERR